jgi:hypothetical protein
LGLSRSISNRESGSECILFEALVDELLKSKPDSRKVKKLCLKLGILYTKSQVDQIEDLLKNGSKIYLNARSRTPELKIKNAESL